MEYFPMPLGITDFFFYINSIRTAMYVLRYPLPNMVPVYYQELPYLPHG